MCVLQLYGVFYATSFLDLYRSPRQVGTASLSLTVTVDSDAQYLFLVSPSPLRDLYTTSTEMLHMCIIIILTSDPGVVFQVRVVSPFLGPPSDSSVVKMIPNERLPPRNLHRVHVDQTHATLKWQPPYDAPNAALVRRDRF